VEQETGQAYVEFWRQFNQGAGASGAECPRTDLLDAMSEDERAQAAMHLLTRFRRDRSDRRLVHALGYLKVAGAVPLLEEAAGERTPLGVEALLALWRIDGKEERVARLVEAVRQSVTGRLLRAVVGTDRVRVAAALALGSVNTEASRAALAEAAQDPDAAVRSSARASLKHLGQP
jgi:HEAT repeat protein